MPSPTDREHLTPEQIEIVEQPYEAKLLVTAGPGTGKTHTLIHRLIYLISKQELQGAGDILVLSFSRAAVKEIKDRCRLIGSELSYIHASTFDSFATRILSEEAPGQAWEKEGYDGRIEAATNLLINNKDAHSRVLNYKHVLLDEIQDLVGLRAELLKAIITGSNVGFSAFGDPAQGIYNFQLKGPERKIGSAALYGWFRHKFGSELNEKSLTRNHRAASTEARIACDAGRILRNSSVSGNDAHSFITGILESLHNEGSYETLPERVGNTDLKTAVLCLNNGQSLMISRRFWEKGKLHFLKRSASDRHLPSWLGLCLRYRDSLRLTEDEFAQIASSVGINGGFQEKWLLMRRTVGVRGRSLDLEKLNVHCRTGLIPDEFNETIEESVVVSTIHRAKGLEFDNVIIAFPKNHIPYEPEYIEEETRTLYVALTRAKHFLRRADLPDLRGLQLHKPTNRWYRAFKRWQTNDLEIKSRDIYKTLPPHGVTSGCPTPKEIQDYIAQNVKRGDPVYFELCEPSSGVNTVFHLVHNDFVIGRASLEFTPELLMVLHRNWSDAKLPLRIESLRVEGVETVFGDRQVAVNDGLGQSGCWLSVRIGGLGSLRY